MGRNMVETVMGAVVLLVAAVFVFFAYEMAHVESVKGYAVEATFYKIGGLTAGSDVRVNGIKVGTVSDRRLDPDTYDAIVSMTISSEVKLPVDTVAAIGSEGLLGDKYIRLQPGTEHEFIQPGGAITRTEDFQSLEDQVGRIIFLATGGEEGQ